MKPFRNHQIPTLVPTSLVKHQKHVFVWPNLLFLCERGQREGEGSGIDGGQEQPTCLSTLRLDKAIQMHPLIALTDHCSHSRSLACSHSTQDRLESNAVLILALQFNAGVWILLVQLFEFFGKFF